MRIRAIEVASSSKFMARIIAQTERLQLRQVTADDLPHFIRLFGDLQVMHFSLTGPMPPVQAEAALLRTLETYKAQQLAIWAVEYRQPPHLFLGLCGFLQQLLSQDVDSGERLTTEWELSYRFFPEFWGQGYATEAGRACRDLAFQNPDIAHLIALIEAENTASIRVAEKVGFTFQETTYFRNILVKKYRINRS